jgi:hypothetical protein
MARLLVEDVTLLNDERLTTLHVRWRGVATRTLTLPRPLPVAERRRTDRGLVAAIDRLLDRHTDGAIAAPTYREHYLGLVAASIADLEDRFGPPDDSRPI